MVTSSVPPIRVPRHCAEGLLEGLPSAIARAWVRLRPSRLRRRSRRLGCHDVVYGFSALWALGVLQIAPIVLAAVMLFTSSSEVMCGCPARCGVGRI